MKPTNLQDHSITCCWSINQPPRNDSASDASQPRDLFYYAPRGYADGNITKEAGLQAICQEMADATHVSLNNRAICLQSKPVVVVIIGFIVFLVKRFDGDSYTDYKPVELEGRFLF